MATADYATTEPDYSAFESHAPDPSTEIIRLSDVADWGYLLQEVRSLYLYMPSGGSDVIRRHIRGVADILGKTIRANPVVGDRIPEPKPVSQHFGRALDNGEATVCASMTRALAKVRKQLAWRHGYDRMPKNLEKKYAYAELLGPRGPVYCEDLIIGLVLFAPRTVYPQHSHEGVTESYVCISGAVSENHAGVYRPGSLILNQDGAQHRITTQTYEPALLLYAWTGARAALASETMVLDRYARKGRG